MRRNWLRQSENNINAVAEELVLSGNVGNSYILMH